MGEGGEGRGEGGEWSERGYERQREKQLTLDIPLCFHSGVTNTQHVNSLSHTLAHVHVQAFLNII